MGFPALPDKPSNYPAVFVVHILVEPIVHNKAINPARGMLQKVKF